MSNDFAPFRHLLVIFVVSISRLCPALCHADLWGISTDDQFSRVIRFDHVSGTELPGGIPSHSAGLLEPSGIATSADGKIFVSSRGTGIIFFFDSATGDPLSLPGGEPGVFANLNMPIDPEGAAAPAQLRFGPEGNLYVSELFGQKIRVYDPATGARLQNAASGLPGAGGLVFEADGSLLVGTAASPDPPIPATISRFHDGQAQMPFFMALQGELAFPASLLFLPNGDMLAVDLFTDQIVRFSAQGQHLGTFATIPTIIAGRPSFPSDIVFDPEGNLIVAVLGPTNPEEPEGIQGQLLRYDLAGNLLQTIASQLEPIGGLAWTASADTLAGDFDSSGNADDADYAKWRADVGKWVATGNGADGNADGAVNAADYVVWRKATAAGSESAAAHAAPEPAACTLAMTAVALFLIVRARRCGCNRAQRG